MKEENLNLKKNEKNFSDNFNPTYKKQPIKQSLPVQPIKKKRNKSKKIFFIFAIILIVGIVGYLYIPEDLGKDLFSGNVNNTKQLPNVEEQYINESDTQIESGKRDVLLKDNLANPRLSIRNGSGDEVIGLDHDGTIEAENLNVTENVNVTGNVTGTYGFFSYIGSLASQVTKIWSTDVVTGDLNATGDIIVEMIKLEANQTHHFIYDNASCVIINGSTSTEYIC